jgi:hypothetical protein
MSSEDDIPSMLAERLLCGSLQLASSANLHAKTSLDLDRFTRGRVATGASGTVGALNREPSWNRNLRAFADGGREGVEESIENGVHGSLALARLSGNSRHELGTV